jgi:hypothetical protein
MSTETRFDDIALRCLCEDGQEGEECESVQLIPPAAAASLP